MSFKDLLKVNLREGILEKLGNILGTLGIFVDFQSEKRLLLYSVILCM